LTDCWQFTRIAPSCELTSRALEDLYYRALVARKLLIVDTLAVTLLLRLVLILARVIRVRLFTK
jgi:hypothetical protein